MQHSIKKSFRLVVLVMTCVFLLVGCIGINEISMYKVIREISNLESVQVDGVISFETNERNFYELLVGEFENNEGLERLIFDSNLNYTLKTNTKTNEAYMGFYIKSKSTGLQQPLTTLIFDGKDLYINMQELLAFANEYGLEDDFAEVEAEVGDHVYLKISEDFLRADSDLTIEEVNEQQKIAAKLTDRFMETLQTIFTNFKGGLVEKQGNKYIIKKDINQMIDLTAETMIYIIDNIDTFEVEISSLIESISEKEYNALIVLTDGDIEAYKYNPTLEEFKQESKTELTQSVEEIKLEKDELKSIIAEEKENMKTSLQDSGLVSMIFETSIEKHAVGLYDYVSKTSATIKNGYGIDANDQQDIAYSLTHTAQITDIGTDYRVTIPTDKVYTYEREYPQYEMYQYMTIGIDHGDFFYYSEDNMEEGSLPIFIKDGSTYVPLRSIAENFGETVGWNSETATPYVMQDNKRVEMKGLVDDGKAYIKLRDLEKLGYSICWNKDTRYVTITK